MKIYRDKGWKGFYPGMLLICSLTLYTLYNTSTVTACLTPYPPLVEGYCKAHNIVLILLSYKTPSCMCIYMIN